MTSTVRPAGYPVARPAQRPVAVLAAVPTIVRPRQDSALFRGWGVKL